jgi:hypothetical protein
MELYLNFNEPYQGPTCGALRVHTSGAGAVVCFLQLIGNQLSGPIPAELGQLGALKGLFLNGNEQLSGQAALRLRPERAPSHVLKRPQAAGAVKRPPQGLAEPC